jgi:hypothetical protein
MKLTDTQLVLLSAASQREDRLIDVGPDLKGAASRKVVGRLLKEGLIEEMPACGPVPVCEPNPHTAPGRRRIGLHSKKSRSNSRKRASPLSMRSQSSSRAFFGRS